MRRDVNQDVLEYQHHYFELLHEFFIRTTGKTPAEFSDFDGFSEAVNQLGRGSTATLTAGFDWGIDNLDRFYDEKAKHGFKLACELNGFKLNIGGSSAFLESHLDAVQRTLLYADCTLIPDPIFPYFERERPEERYRYPKILEAAFTLLHLKPYIDANLSTPPFFIFPSWEKMLEKYDKETNKQLVQMNMDFYSFYIDPGIESPQDLAEYINRYPDKFLKAVEQSQLFIPPGVPTGTPIIQAIAKYDEYVREWRSDKWLKHYQRLSPQEVILNAINERILPQYHLLENCSELHSHPLIPIPQQAHYFKLISHMNSSRLYHLGFINKTNNELITALSDKRFSWFSNISQDALVELRRNDENALFRQDLLQILNQMNEASLEDSDYIIREIANHFEKLHAKHDKEIQKVKEKYKQLHTDTVIAGFITLGAMFIPSLAPFIGASAPIVLAMKYGKDKKDELKAKKMVSKSLMGILAEASPNE